MTVMPTDANGNILPPTLPAARCPHELLQCQCISKKALRRDAKSGSVSRNFEISPDIPKTELSALSVQPHGQTARWRPDSGVLRLCLLFEK